jgi:AcrR family transcriptional regulator
MATRTDAARNRRRVLDAAAAGYAEHGPALGMQEVARRAGVGVGTVYRHFATREQLIDAIALPFFERCLGLAEAVQREQAPAARFAAFVRAFAGALAEHGVSGHCSWDSPAARPVRSQLRAAIAGFVEDGRAAGTLRGDLTREDAFALLWTVAALIDASRGSAPAIWQRHVELVLDGLRPQAAGALAVPAVGRSAWNGFVAAQGRERA